jgi:hypothetical protein
MCHGHATLPDGKYNGTTECFMKNNSKEHWWLEMLGKGKSEKRGKNTT